MSRLPLSVKSVAATQELCEPKIFDHGTRLSSVDGEKSLNALAQEFVPHYGESQDEIVLPSSIEKSTSFKTDGTSIAEASTGGVKSQGEGNSRQFSEARAAQKNVPLDHGKGILKMGHPEQGQSSATVGKLRPAPRPTPPRRQTKTQPFNKELFLQANFRFLVSDLGDYNTSDPDKMIQWEDISVVELSAAVPIQCPICLDTPPLCPQITSCGHIFCFPCILRYFMMGEVDHRVDHWKKCPLCFSNTSCKELRTVHIQSVNKYSVGDHMSFRLLTRAKNSIIPFHNNSNGESIWNSLAYTKDGKCHMYSKITLTSEIELATKKAIAELTEWSEKAYSGNAEDAEQLPYVFAAIDQLKERKVAWDEHRALEFISSSLPVKQRILAQVKAGITKIPTIGSYSHEDSDTGKTSQYKKQEVLHPVEHARKKTSAVRVNAFTDEEERGEGTRAIKIPENIPDAWESLTETQESVKSEEKEVCPNNKSPAEDPDFYSFYQSVDGQLMVLHPLNMKCLLQHYGSYKAMPASIEGKICEMETVTQSEASRKRYRYLSHLPLTSTFQLCEIDLGGFLPRSALNPFADELNARRTRRQRRLKQEREMKANEERREAIVKPPSPADFVAIMNAIHCDQVPTSADFSDGLVTAASVVSSSPPNERKLFSRVTQLGFAAGHDAPQLVSEDVVASVTVSKGGSLSFADVIQKESVASTSNNSGNKKKGKKGSKLLLSTAGGRRY